MSETISMVVFTTLHRHLWYLGQESAPVSLFSDLVRVETKIAIVSRLKQSMNEKADGRSLR